MRAVPEHPITIRIEITTRCNARCFCCNRQQLLTEESIWHLDEADMTWETFEKALGFVGPGTNVDLFGLGEPMLHPRLIDMVAAVSAAGGVPRLSTNGGFQDAELLQRLTDAGLKYIVFSLYAADPKLHEFLQPGVGSGVAWGNFETAVRLGYANAAICIMLTHNLPDTPAIVRRVAECGGKTLILQQVSFVPGTWLEAYAPSFAANVEMTRYWVRKARAEALRLGLHIERCYHPSLQ